MKNSWITIHDNSLEARAVYVSESVTDNAGWEPEEIIGTEAYDLFHPGDHASLQKVHTSNVLNEKMSSMVSYRFKCKNGGYAPVETIVHYCHDVLISCNFIYDENALDHKMRVNTVDEVFVCLPDGSLQLAGAWNDRQEKMEDNLSPEKLWINSKVEKSQERRFCLILNRFANDLNIVYASKLAKELVSMDVPNSIGLSFFDFVPERDIDSLQAQIDLAKEHDMVVRLRFDWVIDREKGISEPVEAITSCTDDGLVMVLRLSPRLFMDD
jgi:PAS domain S-box-containing protein